MVKYGRVMISGGHCNEYPGSAMWRHCLLLARKPRPHLPGFTVTGLGVCTEYGQTSG